MPGIRTIGIISITAFCTINFVFIMTCQSQSGRTCDCTESSLQDKRNVDGGVSPSHRVPSSVPTISKLKVNATTAIQDSHHLAVIIPFRDRWEELVQFVPHIHQFLNRQRISHNIMVVNQADNHRFNRAMLINVGYTLSRNHSDYFVMHDVDLLPQNDDLSYAYPSDGPLHIASPELHPLYHYKKFVGGIMMMANSDFEKINGLTNIFWGWGREDDEFYLRMTEAGLKLNRPQGIKTGYKTFLHLHDKEKRPRDMTSIGSQRIISRRRDKETGLSNLKYELMSNIEMTISGASFTLVNVKLHCDYQITPFCDHQKS